MIKKLNNISLHKAKVAKKDEFYTQISCIEKELKHYKEHFKDKVIYCNCDDLRESNFVKYFRDNFKTLELKRLIVSGFSIKGHSSNRHLILNLLSEKESILYPDREYKSESIVYDDKLDGDFRSKTSIEFLKQADIVVTNPPFSIFGKYIDQLLEYNKDFIIMGNINAIVLNKVFKHVINHKIIFGQSIRGGGIELSVPIDYDITMTKNSRIDEKGNKFISIGGVRWFTNINYKIDLENLILTKTYKGNEGEYPKYDNYDAINVNRVKDIPRDYEGKMGVPITFMDKYNPKQFEIVDKLGRYSFINGSKKGTKEKTATSVNGIIKYSRIVIINKNKNKNNQF